MIYTYTSDMNFNLTGVKQHAHRFCKENWRFYTFSKMNTPCAPRCCYVINLSGSNHQDKETSTLLHQTKL